MITNAQLDLALAVPTITIITALAVYLMALTALRRDVQALLAELNAAIADLKERGP